MKIKILTLFETLIKLDKKDYTDLEELYGEFWYEKLFISHHISFTMKEILKSTLKENEIKKIEKYTEDEIKKAECLIEKYWKLESDLL